MSKIKILIVEDEMIISNNIKFSLMDSGYDITDQAINYTEAITALENEIPDIALLDIQLSGSKSGIELASEINKRFKIPFIFLTSNSDSHTVNKAKSVEPAAYLIKPFSRIELSTSIEIALYNFSKRHENALNQDHLVIKDSLFIKVNKTFTRIDFKDILFVKSDHIYIEINMFSGTKHVVRGSLNEYINKLSANFFRCHRSYIVNLDYLQTVTHNELVILEKTIPLGKRHREELLSVINKS